MSAIQFSYEPASLPSRFDSRQVNDIMKNIVDLIMAFNHVMKFNDIMKNIVDLIMAFNGQA